MDLNYRRLSVASDMVVLSYLPVSVLNPNRFRLWPVLVGRIFNCILTVHVIAVMKS